MTDDLDRMLSGGAKGAKFEKEGDTIRGIVDEVLIRQATEFGTGKPLTFDNGDPREQIVVIIKAEGIFPEDENDDLYRAVYVKGWGQQRRAFIQAVRDAGKPEKGSHFTATFTRQEPSRTGGFPSKVFEYRIEQREQSPTSVWATEQDPGAEAKKVRGQAQTLLERGGFTNEQIAAATGLDVEEIRALGAEMPF